MILSVLKERGLSKEEAEKKLKQYGLNELKDVSRTTPLKILLRQIKSNFVVYLLVVAMLISFFVGKQITAYTILAVIFTVIVVGFIQEYRSEKAVSALKSMLVSFSLVLRDGKEKQLPSSTLVPGDVVILRNGEKIPADCLLLEELELRMHESVLTGESKEITKKIGDESNYSDENMVFMGTYIVNGRCTAKVIHTGMNTKFGKIADLISTTEKDLPLQKKVNKIAKFMVIVAIVISILTGLLMLVRSPIITEDVILSILIFIIALSVAAFPEGFPVVLIATLASGAHRMAKQNAIVNRMSIIETLGETTIICSDKTGTITKGEMTVKKIFAANSFFEVTGAGYESKGDFLSDNKKIDALKNPVLELLLRNSVLCNDSIIERTGEDNEFKAIGSPTESALMVLGAKAGFFKEDMKFERVQEIPFNSERKMMSVLCHLGNQKFVYSKGAPEFLIKKCKFIQTKKGVKKLNNRERKKILEANMTMASTALRTVAFAYKTMKTFSKDHFEQDLIFIGLAGMEDPPRPEVKEALRICQEAGIKVKMITGDNKETALAIAEEIGLSLSFMEGHELDNITDDELAKIIDSISIFARVRPDHKLRIVNALKANGEIVTMTGDGVNDAPALKEAQIGVAMGKNGTDVSRSISDLTLKDDNFGTIVNAISEGRTIFKNIRKFVTYQLSCSYAELFILFFGVLLAPLLGWQTPLLLALHILFMNLVTSDLPAITLGFNPASKDAMIDKPRKNTEIMNKRLIILLIVTGSILALLVLSSYVVMFNILGSSFEYARTVALFSLICLEIVSAFNYRSFRKGVLNRKLNVNPQLLYASIISLVATFIIIYSPINKVFETVPLGIDGLIAGFVVSLILVLVFDLFKYFNNKKKFFDLEHI